MSQKPCPSKAPYIGRQPDAWQQCAPAPSSIQQCAPAPSSIATPQPTMAPGNIRRNRKNRPGQRARQRTKKQQHEGEERTADPTTDVETMEDATLAEHLQNLAKNKTEDDRYFLEPGGEAFDQCRASEGDKRPEPLANQRQESFAELLWRICQRRREHHIGRRATSAMTETRSISAVPPVFTPPESLSDTAYFQMRDKQQFEEELELCQDITQFDGMEMEIDSTVKYEGSLEFDPLTQLELNQRKSAFETTLRNHRIMRSLLDQAAYLDHVQVYGGVKFDGNETKDMMTVDQRPRKRSHTDTYFATITQGPWSDKTLLIGSDISNTTIVRQ